MKLLLTALVSLILLGSCRPLSKIKADYQIFQRGMDSLGTYQIGEPKIIPLDFLDITLYTESVNQRQVDLYRVNTPNGYQVDGKGFLEMPMIGKVHANGLTNFQLADTLKKRYEPYIKDPGVIVNIRVPQVKVIGETEVIGYLNFRNIRPTLMDAIALAKPNPKTRIDSVFLIREDNGIRKSYSFDLRDLRTIYRSEAYYLQQNDVLIFPPSKRGLIAYRNGEVGDLVQPLQVVNFALGAISILLSLAILVTR